MKFKKIANVVFFTTIATAGIITLMPTQTFADNICENDNIPVDIRTASGCPNTGVKTNDLSTVIQNILNAIIGVAGLISVAYIVVGGIQYITSSGDSNKTEKAKKTILYALIGLIVCALSFAIVNFTISRIIYNNNSSDDDQSAYVNTSHTWISDNHQ